MRANLMKQAWSAGRSVLNGWLMIPSTVTAEMMSRMGWDSLTIDLQHGLIDYGDALPMLQALSVTDVTPLVRVPSLEAGIIGKMLDAGAFGIICPMINTREQCEHFVRSCRYAPLGHRSMGPVRATMYAGADYGLKANGEIVAMAMIETVEAVHNIDAILATPGLDAIFVGPSDLSVSFGQPPGFEGLPDLGGEDLDDVGTQPREVPRPETGGLGHEPLLRRDHEVGGDLGGQPVQGGGDHLRLRPVHRPLPQRSPQQQVAGVDRDREPQVPTSVLQPLPTRPGQPLRGIAGRGRLRDILRGREDPALQLGQLSLQPRQLGQRRRLLRSRHEHRAHVGHRLQRRTEDGGGLEDRVGHLPASFQRHRHDY